MDHTLKIDVKGTLETLKEERSALKTKITKLSKRLKNACDKELDSYQTVYSSLEECYCDYDANDPALDAGFLALP